MGTTTTRTVFSSLLRLLQRSACGREVVEEWHRVERVRREAMKSVVSGEVVMAGGRSGEAAREVLFEGVEEEVEEERKREEEEREREKVKEAGREFIAHVPLPDEKEIGADGVREEEEGAA
ncbi:hypothetical protein PR202_ga01911 [Eleusine coracana subsp. coracana]|uniref:Uncharacterized protein n=1 Tax=Eleusine coracana subsp. coracana TaxID=191504 RepID=A0AAV5BIP5_ELECO|nr:hypothetical protein PR202_ga01224 [Eleusine coracana subsp. coracana]GJM86091.1 hypothetical protein PR202_ga01911 [Eleusine coracana subsp. coracana]